MESTLPNADVVRNSQIKRPSKLFTQVEIYSQRWNVNYPYQLMVLKAVKTKDDSGKDSVSYEPTKMFFTLPMSPQELNLDMPIATTVQPTLAGVIEQHGGSPFRMISIQGTTGVVTDKNSGTPGLSRGSSIQSAVQSIFAGTIAQIGTLGTATQKLNINKSIATSDMDLSNDKISKHAIGYYQYLMLERFIESYVNMKEAGGYDDEFGWIKDLRLAFAIWKENQIYLVAGINLTKRRTSSSPLEYLYNLQLKAWSRISLSTSKLGSINIDAPNDPNKLQKMLDIVAQSSEILSFANSVVNSVIDDPSGILKEKVRQIKLYLKDATNTATSILDFPQRVQESYLDLVQTQQVQYKDLQNSIQGSADAIKASLARFPAGQGTPNISSVSKTLKIDSDVEATLDKIPTSSIPNNPFIQKQIKQELSTVRNFNRLDFEIMKSEIKNKLDLFTDRVGQGDEDYHVIYDLSTSAITSRTTTPLEWDAIFALSNIIQVLDHLSASYKINPLTPTSIDYVAGLAEKSGVAFKKPQSKFSVPFPYGFSLERLALQYLGDANRWEEIAVLNGLRNPYIDEEGFDIVLQTNGNSNKIVVENTGNLFTGQTVWIAGTVTPREKRHIIDIVNNGDKSIISLDGDLDLDKFTVSDNATLSAFLPGTVNSQKSIYIPSDNLPSEDPEGREIPGVDIYDPLLQISGVDLLLSENGDLIVTESGDCKMAYGLANIVQTIKLALSTPKGSLLQHPGYGLGIIPGTSLADINAQDILELVQDIVADDKTFSGVNNVSVNIHGNTTFINLEVGINGVSQYIPLTFKV